MKTHFCKETLKLFMILVLTAVIAAACGRKTKPNALGAYGLNQEFAAFEVQCNPPPPPPPPTGESANPMGVPLPTNLPVARTPIEVGACPGLGGEPPHFLNREMYGFAVVVDCNAKVVRFRTHDWEVAETVGISPDGSIDGRIMHITRLVNDGAGNDNCWVRMLGHVTGTVNCHNDQSAIRANYKVDWTFDETPPEVMEPPAPGLADLRNGKHCKILPGNCLFTNNASVGCGG